MKENKLRKILREERISIATRIESTWPGIVEMVGSTECYDYVEFVAEYAPYTLEDLENICRAAELHNMGSMIKVDFQNRGYVAQRAMASGFQGILLADHKNPDEVKESVYMLKPDCPADGGRMGFPNSRWIGYQPHKSQKEYARMVRETVIALMIEKKEAVENIEEICSIPGIDMVQFGPSDYSLSCGWNKEDNIQKCRIAEQKVIETALAHNIQPRCEIHSPEEAKYYITLGVRHFCIGDEMKNNQIYWEKNGEQLRRLVGESS